MYINKACCGHGTDCICAKPLPLLMPLTSHTGVFCVVGGKYVEYINIYKMSYEANEKQEEGERETGAGRWMSVELLR